MARPRSTPSLNPLLSGDALPHLPLVPLNHALHQVSLQSHFAMPSTPAFSFPPLPLAPPHRLHPPPVNPTSPFCSPRPLLQTFIRRLPTLSVAHSLRQRIASVQAAEKIVSALRLVSAARIRASSAAALRTRPFAEEVQRMLSALLWEVELRNIDVALVAHRASVSHVEEIGGVSLADPVVQKALLDRMYLSLLESWASRRGITVLAVITADKGFCGSYNKYVIRKTRRRMDELAKGGRTVELVLVGNTARLFFDRHYPHIRRRFYTDMGKTGDAELTATAVSHALLSEYIGGGVERVEVIYTRFVSLISSMPSARTLLPLTPMGVEAVGDELFELRLTTENGRLKALRTPWGQAVNGRAVKANAVHSHHGRDIHKTSGYTSFQSRLGSFYKISDEEAILLLNSMLPMYVTSQLIRIIREAIAAEHASRLAAMTAATDNAREIVAKLRLEYNKERQAKITNEIIEVVTNADA